MIQPASLSETRERRIQAVRIAKLPLIIALLVAASGCVAMRGPVEPPGVSNQVRSEIQHLAIRGPNQPTITLTSDLDGRGAASGKTAAAASLAWLGGTMAAAGEAEEAGLLVLAAGLVVTPVVAAGGAMYGAAAADSKQAIEEGNETLATVLEFVPDRMRHVLEQRFDGSIPVHYEFAGDLSDAELAAQGFNAVLDIHMDTLSSAPSQNEFHTWFRSANRAELRVFGRPDLTRHQSYEHFFPSRAVSSWAKNGGSPLLVELDQSYQDTAENILDYFFLDRSIQVQGLEPVSSGWRVGQIPGTRPIFAWTARDGELAPEPGQVDYELLIYEGREAPERGVRTQSTSYVPPDSLAACQIYQWQVRAHYESFGEPTTSDWSPVYRFKTECSKNKSIKSERS